MAKELTKQESWDTLWGNYIDKLDRLEELKAQGRYGYQLRMPKLAVKRAREALVSQFPQEAKGL